MKIVNLTAHNVDICDEYGRVIKTYKPSGIVVRNAWFPEQVDIVDGVSLMVRKNERIVNLPEPQDDTMYIVSDIVRTACADRYDLISPAQQVKINGRVVGCMAFMCNG